MKESALHAEAVRSPGGHREGFAVSAPADGCALTVKKFHVFRLPMMDSGPEAGCTPASGPL